MNSQEKIEVKSTFADPSALGLFGLAMVTLVASSQKLGWTTGTSLLMPWAIFLGSAAQIIAGYVDFKKNNVFGGTAFFAYGLFWAGVAMGWGVALEMFGEAAAANMDTHQTGVAYVGYLIFTLFMTVGAAKANKVLFIIFALIDVLFLGLSLSTLGIAESATHMMAAIAELLIACVSFYGSAANVLNHQSGKTVLPLGKPVLAM